MADEEDSPGIGAGGQFGGQGFAFRFVVSEADFNQRVVGEHLVEGGDDGIGDTVMADVDNGSEFLGARFEFAKGRALRYSSLDSGFSDSRTWSRRASRAAEGKES